MTLLGLISLHHPKIWNHCNFSLSQSNTFYTLLTLTHHHVYGNVCSSPSSKLVVHKPMEEQNAADRTITNVSLHSSDVNKFVWLIMWIFAILSRI